MLLPVEVAVPYPDANESQKGPRHALLAQFEHVQDGQEDQSLGKIGGYFTRGGRIKNPFLGRSMFLQLLAVNRNRAQRRCLPDRTLHLLTFTC